MVEHTPTTTPDAISSLERPDLVTASDHARWFSEVRAGLVSGRLVPYLGPGVAALAEAPIPTDPRALADFLGRRVSLPRRARGDAGAAAQYIESHRHRNVLVQLMVEAFSAPARPLALHRWLAELPLPLIVDTWYDGMMREALSARSDWGEIQGVRRSGLGGDAYYRTYDAAGVRCESAMAEKWRTVLYKPHGSCRPDQNFLVSDSDYVEVLTEIDIQTPIPEVVKARRTGMGFVFLGCRMNDQTLRSYARQIRKRSGDQHYIVVEPGVLTRNEEKFIEQQGMTPIACPLPAAIEGLMRT